LAVLAGSLSSGDNQLNESPFAEHPIDKGARGTASIYACDIDGDGDIDVLGAVLEDNAMVCWRNDGGKPIAWEKEIIDSAFASAISVHAADLDGDGDRDVVGAAARGDEVAVWYNEGGDPLVWTKQTLNDTFDFAHEVTRMTWITTATSTFWRLRRI
jgi:hypothetical protein